MGETVELGEAGETGDMIQTGELGRVSQVIGELGVPGITSGELGEGRVSIGERGEGAWRNKRKSTMKDKGGKTGRLEDAATGTDTSDCESMSALLLCSELSGTMPDRQDFELLIKDLETEIVEQEAIDSSTGDRGGIEILQSKKMALASLLDNQVQGALVRSLIHDITEMNAPSSFFSGLEKKRGQNLLIHSLFSSAGQELVEPGQIRQRAVEFFSSLYESEYCRDDGLFNEFCGDLPRVSEETNSRLDRPLQLDELHAALLSMKGRKALGVHGLTVEFFKAFWDIVAHDMLEGNLQEIKNWRPVSLLCMDYRILSKTLASRLREAMEQVIHRDQTYYQAKAFDRVEHEFLWKVMERFGFSPGFIAMIRVLYCDIASMMKFNGSLCVPFRVRRGVRQGCALSEMLYALSLKPLLSRNCTNMDGLGVLYLPREEGGQGLIHLASRTATFRIQEPTVHGARLDVLAKDTPRPTAALWRTRTFFFQHVVAVPGPDLTGAEAVAAHLGNLDGTLLRPAKTFSRVTVDKKTLYNNCVRVLNRGGLSNRSTSVWADRLGGDGARPCWRVTSSGVSYMGPLP
ncbi:Transposon TX1 uncharacterized 149 kDa protein ORF 2 [Takifugu flavidus]|uniref:Transposon TX1 uncharacterized 149 kDa protein ORF 2 n=1 Tax=Takifugu flavidus TaxID=433684 RepID=A0A5C6MNT7_9TELE|nr:Transposon TX1 uncharacterized 149 kDa protein ORF 2 [Takifugu flavidus]